MFEVTSKWIDVNNCDTESCLAGFFHLIRNSSIFEDAKAFKTVVSAFFEPHATSRLAEVNAKSAKLVHFFIIMIPHLKLY